MGTLRKKSGSYRSIYNPTEQTIDFITFLKFMTELLTLNEISFIQQNCILGKKNLRLPLTNY